MPEIVGNNLIDSIKKKQVIEEIASANPSIPPALLELIWDSVKKMDDRKLKQLRKGTYKFKQGQRIVRKEYEDGQVLKQSVEIMENAVPPVNNIIEIKDDDKVQDAIEEEGYEQQEGSDGDADAGQLQEEDEWAGTHENPPSPSKDGLQIIALLSIEMARFNLNFGPPQPRKPKKKDTRTDAEKAKQKAAAKKFNEALGKYARRKRN